MPLKLVVQEAQKEEKKWMISQRASEVQKKLVGKNGTGSTWLDKTKKNDFIENEPKEDIGQALTSRMDRDKCKWVIKDMNLSRSSI